MHSNVTAKQIEQGALLKRYKNPTITYSFSAILTDWSQHKRK